MCYIYIHTYRNILPVLSDLYMSARISKSFQTWFYMVLHGFIWLYEGFIWFYMVLYGFEIKNSKPSPELSQIFFSLCMCLPSLYTWESCTCIPTCAQAAHVAMQQQQLKGAQIWW